MRAKEWEGQRIFGVIVMALAQQCSVPEEVSCLAI